MNQDIEEVEETEDAEKIEIPDFKKEHNDIKVRFSDIGGQEDIIKELERKVIFPIKYPDAFNWVKINKGILFYGPPRRDKTLIASALANEIDAHYLKIGADDLTTSLVGETEKNWRDLFKKAKDNQPAILFIDEFDAISKERTGTETSRYQDSLVSQILNLMSDLEKSDDMVFVITKEIFTIHSRHEKLDKNLDVNELCKKMHENKFNGAQIADVISMAHFEAMDRPRLFDKMKKGTFVKEDMKNFSVKNEDCEKAFKKLLSQKADKS